MPGGPPRKARPMNATKLGAPSHRSAQRGATRERERRAREVPMAAVKLIVMYPPPTDVAAFERRYMDEHVPMAVQKLQGKTKIVATKVLGSPQGKAAFHRIVEVHFPSME